MCNKSVYVYVSANKGGERSVSARISTEFAGHVIVVVRLGRSVSIGSVSQRTDRELRIVFTDRQADRQTNRRGNEEGTDLRSPEGSERSPFPVR